jgi:hypothetical protein
MGKWSALAEKFPELPYDEVLQRHAEGLAASATVSDLTELINETRTAKDEIEASLKATTAELEIQSRALLMVMARDHLESVVANGYKWTPKIEPYPQITDRAALRAWVDRMMPEALTLPFQTLTSNVKAALEGSGPMPEGVDVFLKKSFTRTKSV